MIDRITIQDVSPLSPPMEVMDVFLTRERIAVPLRAPLSLYPDDYRRETRAEYGRRLRYAADEAGRFLADQITNRLREMGHLV